MQKKLLEIIDFDRINGLLEGFNKTTGFVTAILDLDGNILSKSGWRHICTEFHRVNPNTAKRCTISDTILANKLSEGEKYHFYECLNGLVDVAVPVIINGQHIANLFSGQFFFKEPDREFFTKQAEKYGFNKEQYLQSLNSVPVFSEDTVKPAMEFLLRMTELIAEITMQQIEQIQLNKDLKESNEKFISIFNSSSTAYTLINNNGKLVDVNPAFLEMSGYSYNEVIGKSTVDLNLIAIQEQLQIKNVTEEGQLNSFEFGMTRKDGTICYLNLSRKKIVINNEELNLGIGYDISKRKLFEEELEENQKQLEIQNNALREAKENAEKRDLMHSSIIHTSMDGFWLIDLNANLLEVNNAYCKMSGYTNTELLSMNIADLEVVESKDEIYAHIKQIIKLGSARFETKHRRKNQSLFDVEVTVQYKSIMGEQMVAFVRDISERKKAERELQNSKYFIENLIRTANVMIIGLNNDGEINIMNEAAEKITGYTYNDLVGKNWFETLVPKTKYPNVWKEFNELTVDNRIPKTFENPVLTKNGEECYISWQNGILKEGNKVSGTISFGIDITDRKNAELELKANQEQLKHQNIELQIAKQKAEESDKLKTAFLQNMSHEIRTPLNSIVGFSELITDPELDNENKLHFFKLINQSSKQLLSIITDIINIATYEAGQEKINATETNVNKICNNISNQLFFLNTPVNVNFSYKTGLPNEESVIITDETKLMQALVNLVGNALKFTNKGHVEFGYALKNNELEFYVEDTGIGIPKEKQTEIFKRFLQVDNYSTRKYGGSGLGLSISKAYVELLGGKMWMQSELGKGTTFFFTIPYTIPQPN